jgi:thioredoxin 1
MRKFYYFTATWCGPCKLYGPVLERVKHDFKNNVEIVKVDVDKEGDMAQVYEVSSVPVLVEVGQNDEAVRSLVGAYPYDKVVEEFNLNT